MPNWVPEAEDPAIKAAVDAGIPVMVYNSGGIEKAKELGALNYIGSDEYLAGKAGGEYFAKHGATKVICVNTVPGAANLEARCKGVNDGMTEAGQPLHSCRCRRQLRQSDRRGRGHQGAAAEGPGVDGVITISQADADSAANGIRRRRPGGSSLAGST